MQLEISILTPDCVRQSGGWGEFWLLTHEPPAIPAELDEAGVERLLASHPYEWSAILVLHDHAGRPRRVCLWRSLTSAFDLFFARDAETLIVSDCFAGCASRLPPEARRPSDDAIIDHFLFRCVLGETTYFESAYRITHGTRMAFGDDARVVERRQFHTCRSHGEVNSESEALRRIDAALRKATDCVQGPDYRLLLSGGVDSTLLATYLTEGQLTNNTVTSPEFAKERAYAESASALLGRPLHVNALPEENYFARLEEIIDKLWMPPHHAQTVILSEAFKRPAVKFVIGEFADGLFGFLPFRRAYYGPWFAKPSVAIAMRLLDALPLRRLQSKLRQLEDARSEAAAFRLPAHAPGSFALNMPIYADLSSIERIFSRREIDRRLQVRYEYVSKFVGFEHVGANAAAQFETGHLVTFFCEDSLNAWRQLASVYGCSLYTPFAHADVFRAAMSIAVPLRYLDRQGVKHLLKKLLARRLPAYPVNRTKLGGVVPIQRYAVRGPLEDWQERYPVPDFIDAASLRHFLENDRSAYWHTVLYSIWQSRIANRPVERQNHLERQAA